MAACVFRCFVVFAFLALTNVSLLLIGATLTTDDNPAYRTHLGGVSMFNIHLGTSFDGRAARVRRSSNDTASGDDTATTSHMASLTEVGTTTTTSTTTTTATTTTTTTMTTTTKATTTTAATPATSTGSSDSLSTTMKTIIVEETNHTYYTSRLVTGSEASDYFLTYDDMKQHGRQTHQNLSENHRLAAPIQISFIFPFYGHSVEKITIATGGFLYMSDFLHQFLTYSQYVAPLMANFDTRLGKESFIHYADNGTAFIVLWENIHLKDDENAGPFTFEVILHMDGTIIFSYYQLPLLVSSITTSDHPVKVGLSDAFYYDQRTYNGQVTQRTISRYHQVSINTTGLVSHTAVIIKPLPTCNIYKSCSECLLAPPPANFKCSWCPAVNRCSSGLDRKRQEWIENKCHNVDLNIDQCATLSTHRSSRFSAGILFAILMLLLVIGAIVGWFVYAYLNPNTKSGQWLIEHRPSRLKAQLAKVKFWKRSDDSVGERYAVSVGSVGSTVA